MFYKTSCKYSIFNQTIPSIIEYKNHRPNSITITTTSSKSQPQHDCISDFLLIAHSSRLPHTAPGANDILIHLRPLKKTSAYYAHSSSAKHTRAWDESADRKATHVFARGEGQSPISLSHTHIQTRGWECRHLCQDQRRLLGRVAEPRYFGCREREREETGRHVWAGRYARESFDSDVFAALLFDAHVCERECV